MTTVGASDPSHGVGGPRVIVVGDVVTDVLAQLAEPIATGSDASATIRSAGGGAAANVAAWLAVAGADPVLVARVGNDEAGEARRRSLEQLGVTCAFATDPDHPTGTIVVLVEPGGERSMLADRGANLHLAPADVGSADIASAAHLHLSGYALLAEGPRAAGLAALREARDAGVPTSVDPASATPLRHLGPGRFLDWTEGCDLCLPNLDELEALSGTRDPVDGARALTEVYRQVVVTLGGGGAHWTDGQRSRRIEAQPSEAVDTTGAGDAFAAGLIAARLSGRPDDPGDDGLDAAVRLAARAVSRPGAQPPGRRGP
ncbi:hypothetical protein ER308_05415 [Egibacter rhizosphaerae]|uniref:Carbohydrate kinase PfkB domain-containing protein n=1 Tax=Egibacter rhizosphaerae TaxID=1670831 RepID=A0A411YD11_9ACTN|nr:PfkB family carbohydrate kinase [Egibacter rhizosphaerae]QBI19037.1 hypothetical protein ER308_05415 [Egibacter rhizosphaerae]